MATRKPKPPLTIEALRHDDAKRRNIPTAEMHSVVAHEERQPKRVAYPRFARGLEKEKAERNRGLDPQLVWRGKDQQDWSDLVVQAPPLHIQEKVHPKALIDDLRRQSDRARQAKQAADGGVASLTEQVDLFADFNGLPSDGAKTEFYQHDANWSNRMILGDSLQVMASLAEREGLRGKVQCIYFDPPYGIKFNSNFQWSTTSRDVKDGNAGHITREPEQVKAFRDTWRDGVHSYLTYLRDRLSAARDLLADSGSMFVQIGDENVHRVRLLLDEVFGDVNCIAQISVKKTSGATTEHLPGTTDYLLFYARNAARIKYRQAYLPRQLGNDGDATYAYFQDGDGIRLRLTPDQLSREKLADSAKVFRLQTLASQSLGRAKGEGAASWFPVDFNGKTFRPSSSSRWKTNELGMSRLRSANRLERSGSSLAYIRFHGDFPVFPVTDLWIDTQSGSAMEKSYVVQTSQKIVERCLLMTTDPGDLVLDPTCGSGTTAYVAEQWGRRWITIDTSRVALALARARITGARYPYYLLADSRDGQQKEAEVTRTAASSAPVHGNVRQGFVYERVPHVTLKSIANNAEIDVIYDEHQQRLESLRTQLNESAGKDWEEWEIPREADRGWPDGAKDLHRRWWEQRIARQKAIDASIAAKAEYEFLYDKPYEDKKKVRVAGPFTVESLSPHRALGVDENDELIDPQARRVAEGSDRYLAGADTGRDFARIMLENLKVAGVQQASKEDRISFTSLVPWPGQLVCAEGRYLEGETAGGAERRAGILIGPEFGTVTRPDLVEAAREAADAGFDVLIACAFNFDARSSDLVKLGRIPVLKARMNADLHMASELKNTGKGNLFVIFGEPDIDILDAEENRIRVKINGVDVFDPSSGEVRSDSADGIACWFIDTDYDEESFFVRHAYFLGANDPYKALKTTLKAEIDEDAWSTLHSDTSRPFDRPSTGRIAVKVINHLGDEVMKVFRVPAKP